MPIKRIPQTDAIFRNVQSAHQRAEKDDSILRISIDTKANVKLGPFSRGGRSHQGQCQRYSIDEVGVRQACLSPSQDRRDRTLERPDRAPTN